MSDDFFIQSREELKEQIQLCLENKDLIKIINCLSAAKVDPDVLEQTLDGNKEPSDVADFLVQTLSDRLDINGFRSSLKGKEEAVEILEQFSKAEHIWFHLIAQLFYQYEHNVAEINRYRNVLLAKKTQTIKRDKWGDFDDSDWARTLGEFANEKLLGGVFEIANKALPYVLQAHLAKVNALNVLLQFAWLIFETGHTKPSLEGTQNAVSQKNGVEFELELRHRIENKVPQAVVELTPTSGDQGADLIVYIGEIKFVIQAKHYTGKVGNSAVQEVHAARGFYKAHIAIVVTNSDFTQSARNLAAELDVWLVYDTQIADLLLKAAMLER